MKLRSPITSKVAAPPRTPPDIHFRIALWTLAGITVLRLAWLSGQPVDLYPDEAQYWLWAQHPDWGYYSKPPLLAWLIWASTHIFGDSDLAIKAPASLVYLFTGLIVYGIGRRLYSPRTGAWSAIAFVTLPAVSISAIIISTDVPLLFFWALATYAYIRGREATDWKWWLVLGVAAGLGLLSKLAMGFWLLSALLHLLAAGDFRHYRGRFAAAVAIALAVYAPNFLWNFDNGFVTYRHTEANANLHGFAFHPVQLLEFVVAQFGVFGPVFLGTWLLIAARWRRSAEPATTLLLCFTVPTILIMIIEAGLSRAQPNWAAPVYVTATILVVGWLDSEGPRQKLREQLLQWSVVLHVIVAVVCFGLHDAARAAHYPLPGRLDPLHRLRGWQTLGRSVSMLRLQAPGLPVLGDDRELMAALIRYMQPHPFDMLAWNPTGEVTNTFEMTQSLPDRPGGDFLWITGRTDLGDVERCFAAHRTIAHIYVPIGTGLARQVNVVLLQGFKGYAATSAAMSPAPAGARTSP